jgi:hypothetical protein
MGRNMTRQELDAAHEERANEYVIGKAPWVYRMCSHMSTGALTHVVTFLLAGSLGAMGGYKLVNYCKHENIKTDIKKAQATYKILGYVPLDIGGKKIGLDESNVKIQGVLKKASFEEAKKEISAVHEADTFSAPAASVITGLFGGFAGTGLIVALLGAGAKAKEDWETDQYQRIHARKNNLV